MKNLVLLLSAIVLFSSTASAQENREVPRRFNEPLDEESEKGNKEPMFSEYVPYYSSSVFTNVNISRDSFPQNETSVKISRKDPNRVVAAWRDFRTGVNPANRKVGYSYSTDGGSTWSVSRLLDSTFLPGFPRNSDPVVNVDSAGNFYISVICIGTDLALAVYKSTDGGVTFPNAYFAANSGTEDKEMFATDMTPGSSYFNTMYISWTRFSTDTTGIKLTKSINGGVNWSIPVAISDEQFGVQGSDVAVGLDGEIYVTWLDANTPLDAIKFDRSTDGGNSFSTDMTIAEGTPPQIPISSSNITLPSIAADISGGLTNGSIYITFCDSRNGDPDVFVCRSTNRGLNWSSPLRINNDAIGNGKLQCWPWIEVNEKGNVAIIFFDARNTTSNTVVEAYLAYSTDGGLSYSNTVISTQPSPTNQPNTAVRFGDYIGIDYYADRIVPVWTDERAGGFNMECYTAIISTPLSISHYTVGQPEKFMLKQNYPNPFNPVTNLEFGISKTGFVSLKVYDMLGKEIVTLVNSKLSPGIYEYNFDGSNLSSGVYFYKLETEGLVDTKKMFLVK